VAEPFLVAFASIASVLFVTELTDKDALLLLSLAARAPAAFVFFAGATAFVITTATFVTLGSLINAAFPILWVKLIGGVIMVGYGLWQAPGAFGRRVVKRDGSVETQFHGWRAFFGIVALLALLDIAGDATEVLTIVFVTQYSDAVLVFAAACTGLIAATAFETALGHRLGEMLTARRIRLVSIVVFVTLGAFIIFYSIT
jgi:putative Ca2+/H+ antiporter (TMEM165/GDT1 family)